MSDFAKELLFKKGAKAFEEVFGSYFICGRNLGAFIQIELT
jgi:hypothetical protein